MSSSPRPNGRPRPSWGWQDDARCSGEPLNLFFGREGERPRERDIREREAKDICSQCPVRAECLEYALARPERAGTWGSLNEDERAAERRRRQRRAAREVAPPSIPAEKSCSRCETTKPAAEFYARPTDATGLDVWCKRCKNADRQARKRRAAEADLVAASPADLDEREAS